MGVGSMIVLAPRISLVGVRDLLSNFEHMDMCVASDFSDLSLHMHTRAIAIR